MRLQVNLFKINLKILTNTISVKPSLRCKIKLLCTSNPLAVWLVNPCEMNLLCSNNRKQSIKLKTFTMFHGLVKKREGRDFWSRWLLDQTKGLLTKHIWPKGLVSKNILVNNNNKYIYIYIYTQKIECSALHHLRENEDSKLMFFVCQYLAL